MLSNPNLMLYTCIATGTTILAEFNSRDADLATLANKCLEKTPNHHLLFTHTVQNHSHTFLINSPFIYFAIYDKKLEHLEALSYLKKVKSVFDIMHLNSDKYEARKMSLHCFQGEFNPVFHQLLAPNIDIEMPFSPRGCKSENSGIRRFGLIPLGRGSLSPRSLAKKRFENNVDFLGKELPLSNSSSGVSYTARRKWKRHVCVVLTLDLVLCLVLFGIWLWICHGFKCIAR